MVHLISISTLNKSRLLGLLLTTLPILSAFAGSVGVSIDALYWQASEASSAAWATTASTVPANPTDLTPESIDFDPDYGVRLGLTYQPSSSYFDTSLYYTTFTTDASNNVPVGNQLIVPEFFSGFLSGNVFFGANADWDIALRELDLQISHLYHPSKTITLRPKIGITAARIDQTVNAQWNAVIYTSTEKVKNDFQGIGPSLGLDTTWNIYKGFSLVGDLTAALMYGDWDISDTYQRPSALLGLITPTTIDTKTTPSDYGVAMYGYFFGLQWAHQGRSDIAFKLGYEMQHWSDQLRVQNFEQLPVHGDLTFKGATCGIYVNI